MGDSFNLQTIWDLHEDVWFYILTLNGVDAALGVNWLQTLGPHPMGFQRKNYDV
jgi:hypothetical protein